MNFPLITIGITCFNAQDTIDNAIQSALDQDYPNIEIIVVDDYSTDNSKKVIEDAYKDKINIILHEKNCGVAVSRNTIINNANTK